MLINYEQGYVWIVGEFIELIKDIDIEHKNDNNDVDIDNDNEK